MGQRSTCGRTWNLTLGELDDSTAFNCIKNIYPSYYRQKWSYFFLSSKVKNKYSPTFWQLSLDFRDQVLPLGLKAKIFMDGIINWTEYSVFLESELEQLKQLKLNYISTLYRKKGKYYGFVFALDCSVS